MTQNDRFVIFTPGRPPILSVPLQPAKAGRTDGPRRGRAAPHSCLQGLQHRTHQPVDSVSERAGWLFFKAISMEQQWFYIVIDYKGRQSSDKAISMQLKSIYNKSFCFNEQRCIFKHGRKLPLQSCTLNLLLYFI